MKTSKIREALRKALIVWVTVSMVTTQSPLAYAMEVFSMAGEEGPYEASAADTVTYYDAEPVYEASSEVTEPLGASSDEYEIAIDFDHAYVHYLDQVVSYPATKIAVPIDREFRFSVEADEGYQLATVECQYVDDNNEIQTTTLEPDDQGEYVLDAAVLTRIVMLSLKAEALSEAEEPVAEEPIAIEETEGFFPSEPFAYDVEPTFEPEAPEPVVEPAPEPETYPGQEIVSEPEPEIAEPSPAAPQVAEPEAQPESAMGQPNETPAPAEQTPSREDQAASTPSQPTNERNENEASPAKTTKDTAASADDAKKSESKNDAKDDSAKSESSSTGSAATTRDTKGTEDSRSSQKADTAKNAKDTKTSSDTSAATDSKTSSDTSAATGSKTSSDSATTPDTEAAQDDKALAQEAPRTKTRYTYEDANVRVIATAERADALPDDAQLKVTPITPTTRAYNYDAYLDALNEMAGEGQAYDDSNTLLYDVAFLVTDEAGNTVEVQPEDGAVRIEFQFKRRQVSDGLGVENAYDLEVTHLPLAAGVRDAAATTADATNISAQDVRVESLSSSDVSAKGDAVAVTATSFSVYALRNTALASAGKAVPVSVNFFDYDGTTPAASTYSQNLYLYVDIAKKGTNEVVAWKAVQLNPYGNTSVTTEFSKFIKVSTNTTEMWQEGDLDFDASQYEVHWVRLYSNGVVPSYKNVAQQDKLGEYDGIPNDTVDGYKFMHSEVVDGVQNIDLKKWNDGKLTLNLTFEPKLSTTIAEGDNYWLRVELKHTKTNTTYFVKKLSAQTAENGVVSIEANEWRDYNGNVLQNEKFTGNEVSVSAQIVHTSQGANASNIIKNENMCAPIPDGGMVRDYVVSYTTGDTSVSRIATDNEQNHDTEATYVITFTKAQAADDYLTLYDILGDGLNYGIVTEHFELLGGDAETNVAAIRGTSKTQTGNDLTNKVEQTFILAEVEDEFKVKGESAYVRTNPSDASKVKPLDNVVLSVDTSSSKEELTAEVRAMLNKGASSSSYFAAQAANASIVAYNQDGSNSCVLDIADRGAGTYYVTVDDDLYARIYGSGRLNIKKDENQVVVFNVVASTSTIEKYNVNGQGADSFLTNDQGHPDTIVWNFINSTSLTVTGSITGIILAPNAEVTVNATSSGWLVAKSVKIGSGEWHNVFQKVVQLRQGTEVAFEAVKQVNGKSAKVGGFEFELAQRNDRGSWTILQTVQNDGARVAFAKVPFDEHNFTSQNENQEYLFRVRERQGSTDSTGAAYVADQTVYYAKVTVTKLEQRNASSSQTTITTIYQAGTPKFYLDEDCTQPYYGTPVFDNARENTSSTSVDLSATKTLEGRGMREGEFTFTLTQTDASWQALAGSEAYVNTKTNKAAVAGQKSAVAFDRITYTTAGVYYYEVREEAGTARGVTYDGATYHVTVVVRENADTEKLEVVSTDIERLGGKGAAAPATSVDFVNTYTAETTEATIKKVWNDAKDQDGKRPESLAVNLMSNAGIVESVALSKENSWTATVKSLPKYDAQENLITYWWVEGALPEGYELTKSDTTGTVTTLTNTHVTDKTSATVKKVWADEDNQDGKRPPELKVTLTANGKNTEHTATLSSQNDWTFTQDELPKYANGKEISYAWAEDEVPEGYRASTVTTAEGVSGTITTLTNTHAAEHTQARVTKVWDDEDNKYGMRPASLKVRLVANGEDTVQSVVLSSGNEWTATIGDLPAYRDGKRISYTWSEEQLPEGYSLKSDETKDEKKDDVAAGTITTLTNTYAPEFTSRSITKVWEDDCNRDGLRPESLTVDLLANGSVVETVELSEKNGWRQTVSELPVSKNGSVVEYTWAEHEPTGYTSSQHTNDNGVTTTLTNAHESEKTKATVVKRWVDDNDRDGLRPASIEVELLANGEHTGRTVVLSEANHWTATIDGLERRQAGEDIAYTWSEPQDANYEATSDVEVSEDDGSSTTTLTNTHRTAETSATIKKAWNDSDNRDGKRPDKLVVSLMMTVGEGSEATTRKVREVTLNEKNGWTETVDKLAAFEGGKAITYTWEEGDLPEGYELTHEDLSADGTVTTLTNSYRAEETSATVRKEWSDDDNRDGKRPESIVVQLTANGKNLGEPVRLSAANRWSYTAEHLPLNQDGKTITYSWTEDEKGLPEGYSLTNTATNGTVTTLTNSYETEKTEATVRKVWDDNDNQDGVRPESLTVVLSTGEAVTLDESNGWKASVSDLPKYENGREIAYSWTEGDLPEGYVLTDTDVEGTITTLTNSHTTATTEACVRKVWDDANNQDGVRPASIAVQLMADDVAQGDPITLDAAHGWKATVTGLPTYANQGEEIIYTWEEVSLPADYELTDTGVEGTVTTLTNTHRTEKTTVTVRKVWDDNDNQDGVRPASVSVQLKADGEALGDPITLSESNNWEHTIGDLPKFRNGAEVEYTWDEVSLPAGYVLKVNKADGSLTTLTNTHETEKTEATVRKVWNDANNQDGMRPASIGVQLMADGEALGEPIVLSAANSWTATVGGLPKYANGDEVKYSWAEDEMPEGYELTDTSVDGLVTTLTNTHETTHQPQTTELSVRKIWNDRDNQDGLRPESLKVRLLANGSAVKEVELSDENKWQTTIENLPMYEDDKAIVYTWAEDGLPEGYELTGMVTSGSLTTLTNTHDIEKTSARVTKVWDDAHNQDGTRPLEVRVALTIDEVRGPAFTLSAANNWTMTVSDLAKYRDGKPISYGWVELSDADGYVLASGEKAADDQEDDDEATELVNTHTTQTTSVSVQKVWNDEDNQDGLRPDRLAVSLLANDVAVQSVELTAENGWKAEVKGLPANANGTPITYTWAEDELPAGYTFEDSSTEGSLTTLTNTHDTETTWAEVHKVWDDAHNQDGTRPSEIIVDLVRGPVVVTSVTLSDVNDWSARVEDLPAFEAGERVVYAWQEQNVAAGYELERSVRSVEATGEVPAGSITTLTNHHTTETTSASVHKEWDDANNRDGLRPQEITLALLDGTHVVATVVLDEGNDWSATVRNLPKYAAGEEIAYMWAEPVIEGYELASSHVNNGLTTLINRHDTQKTEATVRKVWNDDDNRDGIRPPELTLALQANGKDVEQVTLSEANGWEATIEGLEANEDGKAITYTWEERDVPSGYTLEGNSAEGTVTTLTNAHETARTEATVRKVWDDNDDQERMRPASIDVTLAGNGIVVGGVTLNEENGWTATMRDLNAFENGAPVNYVWTEDALPEGYELTSSEREGTITTLTNTLTNAPTASLGLSVAKSLEGRAFNENDRYTFRVSAMGADTPLPQHPVVTIMPAEGGTATVDFGTITYSHASAGTTYEYGIEETGTVGGVTNDPHAYRVEVAVADAGDGTMTATPTYYYDDEQVDGIEFVNTYEAQGTATVQVRKSVAGRAWNEGETHEFVLTALGGAPLPEGADELRAQATAEGEAVSFDAIPYTSADAGKTYDYRIVEVLPTDEDGSELTEQHGLLYDTSEHVAHVSVEDTGDGTLTCAVTYDDDQTEPALFTNAYAAQGSVEIGGFKAMENRAFNEADEYTFTLVAPEGTPLPEEPRVTIRPTEDDPTFAFGPITYALADAGNTYTYEVHEEGSVPGVANDERTHTVQVAVADNGDGTLSATPTYYVDGEQAEALVFANTYEARGTYELTATKHMSGRAFNDQDRYTFTLETDSPDAPLPTNAQGEPVTEVTIEPREGTVAPVDFGTIAFDLGSYTADGRPQAFTYTIHESAETTVPGVTNELASVAHWVTLMPYDNGDGTLDVRVVRSGIDNDDALDPEAALTITNTYEAAGEVVLEATKRLEGKELEAGEFTFALDGDNVHQTATNDVDGKVAFEPITYRMDQIGETYTYTISEVNEGKNGYEYDEATHTAAVTVFDKGDGTLGTTVVYDDDTSAKAPEFVNTYFAANAKITFAKHFYGMGDEQFEFVLAGANESWEPREGGTVEATGDTIADNGQPLRVVVSNGAFDEDGTAEVKLPTLTYAKPGTYRYVLFESPTKDDANDEALYRITVVVSGDQATEVSYELQYGDEVTPVETMDFYNNALVGFAYRSRTIAAMGFMAEEASVQPKVGKRFEGGTLEEGAFRFALLDAQGVELQEATNDAEGTVAFDRLYFTEPGTYEYYLVEKAGTNELVVYDPSTIRYVVTVTQNEAGELQAEEAFTGNDDEALDEPAFVNSIRHIRIRAVKRSREAPYDPLVGSTYGMWMANPDGNDVYMGNSVSNENGELFYDIPVAQGYAYYLLEEKAPHGHLVDPYPTDYFTLGKNDDGYYLVYQEDPEFYELVPELKGKVLA